MTLALASFRAALTPPWVKNELWCRAQAVPSLDLRFADNKSLTDAVTGSSLVTFTRASSGTFVGSNGVLQTATNDVARFDHNPTTGESLGLLVEEARTNLLLNSATLSTQLVTVAAAANTLSFYGTGTVTLTGVSTAGPLVGTGANNRVSLTFTPTVGVLILTVSGSVTNAQLEAGAFATSYIPTTSATVTRAADVASITGTNFSSWYNQTEGTVFAETQLLTNASNYIASFTDNTGNNHHFLRYAASQYQVFSTVGGAANTAIYETTGNNVLDIKNAYAIRSGQEWRIVTKGVFGAFSSVTSATPIVDRLIIAGSQLSGAPGSLRLRRLTYWPPRLANTTLQAITR